MSIKEHWSHGSLLKTWSYGSLSTENLRLRTCYCFARTGLSSEQKLILWDDERMKTCAKMNQVLKWRRPSITAIQRGIDDRSFGKRFRSDRKVRGTVRGRIPRITRKQYFRQEQFRMVYYRRSVSRTIPTATYVEEHRRHWSSDRHQDQLRWQHSWFI